MTYQTLPLSQITVSADNPRKAFDAQSIEGLAQSIAQDGLLQNLVVAKAKGKKDTYTIISGERRFRALSLLAEQGAIADDYAVIVDIRAKLSDDDRHRIATVENLQRENMHPMDEAEAIALLLAQGENIDEVAAKTGLSLGVIKRRAALANLCDTAKQALRANDVTLSQAEALTLGTHDQQEDVLDGHVAHWDADDIKSHLTDTKPVIATAIFDVADYTGTYTHDLFADDNATYFDDTEQFMALQAKAVQDLQAAYTTQGYDPVEVIEGYGFSSWHYRDADSENGEQGGVVIQVFGNGRVERHEGIISNDLNPRTREETQTNPIAEKPTPFYNAPMLDYIATHKTLAVQAQMINNRRIAKQAAVAQMIGSGWYDLISLKAHKALSYLEQDEDACHAMTHIRAEATTLLEVLGVDVATLNDPIEIALLMQNSDAASWYDALQNVSDDDLDRVHVFLTTLCFGQGNTTQLDSNAESLFNRVAADLNVEMRHYWYADETFLKRRNKDQLAAIVEQTQTSHLFSGAVSAFKKGVIVTILAAHFKDIFAQDDHDTKQSSWCPNAFLFPALDEGAVEGDDLADDAADYAQAA